MENNAQPITVPTYLAPRRMSRHMSFFKEIYLKTQRDPASLSTVTAKQKKQSAC